MIKNAKRPILIAGGYIYQRQRNCSRNIDKVQIPMNKYSYSTIINYTLVPLVLMEGHANFVAQNADLLFL